MLPGFRGAILTQDSGMVRLLKMAEQVAPTRASVLISGERGTGKALMSRYIHSRSLRAEKEPTIVHLAGASDHFLANQSVTEFRRKLRQAHGSTLIIHDADTLPVSLQDELYQALYASPTGDIRLVATTTSDLRELVRTHNFLDDLHYRMSVINLQIPPLRTRPNDIAYLGRLFMDLAVERNGLTSKQLGDHAIRKLQQWTWPGNLPELEAVMERSVLLSKSQFIGADDILLSDSSLASLDRPFGAGMTISEAEKKLIFKTLEYTRNNKTQAASLLGISIRTLRNKLHEYQGGGREQLI